MPSIIVGDGDKDRTNRKILLNPNMKYIGISVQPHQDYDYMVLFIFCNEQYAAAVSKCQCILFWYFNVLILIL